MASLLTNTEWMVVISLAAVSAVGFAVDYFKKPVAKYQPPVGEGWKCLGKNILVRNIPGLRLVDQNTFSPSTHSLVCTLVWERNTNGFQEYFMYTSSKFFSSPSTFDYRPIYIRRGFANVEDRTIFAWSLVSVMHGYSKDSYLTNIAPNIMSKYPRAFIRTESGNASAAVKLIDRIADVAGNFALIERFEDTLILVGTHGWKGESATNFFSDSDIVVNIFS